MIILKTHFFLVLYQSETTLETQQASILLKRSFEISYDLVPIVFSIFIIPLRQM